MTAEAAWRDLPAGAVYQQEFTVRYDYPVYFTEQVFARDNPVFEHALCRREPGQRHRFVAFIDANVAASWPALAHDIAAYAQSHGDTMELVAPPEVVAAGEQVEERSGVAHAAAAAAGRTRDRPPFLRRRRGRRRGARHGGLRGGHHASRRAAHPRPDHGAGAERFRRRRQERRQRLRHEELARQFRSARCRAQRLQLPAHAASARPHRRHGRGGQGRADPRRDVLRVAGGPCRRPARIRSRGRRAHDPALRGAAHAPDRARRRSVRDGAAPGRSTTAIGRRTSSRRSPRTSCATARRWRSAWRSTRATRCRSACCRPAPRSACTRCSSGSASICGIRRWKRATSDGRCLILGGLEEFREHLGGELTVTLLRRHRPGRRGARMDARPDPAGHGLAAPQGDRPVKLGSEPSHLLHQHPPGRVLGRGPRATSSATCRAVKRRVCPDAPFGVGLRLSAAGGADAGAPDGARTSSPASCARTICTSSRSTAFPTARSTARGSKEDVYLPDWRDEAARVHEPAGGPAGGVAAAGRDESAASARCPVRSSRNAATPEAVAQMADRLIRHVAHLVARRARHRPQDRRSRSSRSPAACSRPSTRPWRSSASHLSRSVRRRRWPRLQDSSCMKPNMRCARHLGVCLDLCHAAVEFEDPADCFGALAARASRSPRCR